MENNIKNIKWIDFDYKGKTICKGDESTYSEMELNAISDLHPKLKSIENTLKKQLEMIPYYNNHLKCFSGKEKLNIIKLVEFIDSHCLKIDELTCDLFLK